ncbi:PAS domain-containing protein [Mucilaginibacter pocheonensis]|uniref:histidine kinase n=1 Tax=Mucilaginibacter pocheonensis TaxID=398050 RepID=A0ABU1THJ5_9SPHI|nr:PAS domain-containing protein [Mucilaginibacter pocheonensis]MDR6944889.1 PAS domain S-box-containing protein [Mucilaginibacter pocheonensis]
MPVKRGSVLSPEVLRVFETLPHPYLILSKQLYILTASNAYLQLTGKTKADLLEKHLFDVFPKVPDWATEEGGIAFSLEQVLKTRKPHKLPITRFDIPAPVKGAELQERYWDTTHTPVLDTRGNISYIIHQTYDVTTQVLTEKNLKASLEKEVMAAAQASQLSRQMRELYKEVPAQIAIVKGPDLVYEFINPQYQNEFFPDRKALGRPLLSVMPEVTGKPIWDILQNVYKTGQSFTGREICIQLANGITGKLENHYFDVVYQAIRDDKGKITGVLSFKYEITELVAARKNLEQKKEELRTLNAGLVRANEEIQATNEELQTSNEELSSANEELFSARQNLLKLNDELEERVELRTLELLKAQAEATNQAERLKRFFMQAPAGVCVLDGPNFVFELVNPAYQQLFAGRALTGKPLLEALPELEDLLICDILKNVYETGNTFEGKELLVPLARAVNGPVEDRYFTFIYQARYDAADKVDGILVFIFEVTDEVLVRQKEKENEERFRFLLNAIPQQVWTARHNGTLDYVNEVVCDDFGISAEEILRKGWQAFIHPNDKQTCIKKWLTALKTGKEYLAEFRLKFHDEQYRWHLARAVPLIENGRVTLWLGTNTNIDIQKTNEQKKDEFLSIASHELKTPLTSIKAFNQLMLRINDPQKLTSFIKKSATHVLRLEKLISDLLDVSRINAGKMEYNMETFNFCEMLADSIDGVQYTAPSHRISLTCPQDIIYTGDRFRLEQVINNLLTNAIKYSPEANNILVNCTQNGTNSFTVSVQDFGIGIEEKNINRLFERYYRVDNTAMRFDGLGLGLFISAEILKRHNGSFWIKSKPGEGSTFFFKLLFDQTKTQEL